MKRVLFALPILLGACGDPSAAIKAMAGDPASPCAGGNGYGVGVYAARGNDPTVNIKVSPTGCEITHIGGTTAGTTVIFGPGTGPKPMVITPEGKVAP